MKILFYLGSIGSGGIGRVVVNLANSLNAKGLKVYVLSDFSDCSFTFSNEVVLLDRPKNVSRLKEVAEVRKMLKQEKPDVIVGLIHFFLWAYLASYGLRVPVIASDHASYEYQPTLISKIFRFHIYKLADAVTILTESDKRYLGKRLKKKVVVPNPIEIPENVKLNSERENVILSAGRLDDWHIKGFDMLIQAWGEIANKHSDWTLQIAGGGRDEDMQTLNGFVKDAGLDDNQIEFLGFRNDIAELMQNSKVFILSSRSEGLPMVLLEAMSNGCVCMATSIGGRGEEILGDAGVAVENSIAGIREGLDMTLNNTQNFEYLSKHAIERAKKYESGNVADMWIELFEKLKYKQ